jgi:hypothetical protein
MRLGPLRQPLGMIKSYKFSFYCDDLTNFVAFLDYDFVSSELYMWYKEYICLLEPPFGKH